VVNAMRYFTRQWYEALQQSSRRRLPSEEETTDAEFTRLGNQAFEPYLRYYDSIKNAIDPNVKQLMDLWLGDVSVEDIKRNDDALHFLLKVYWDRRRQSATFEIRFSGVTAMSGIESCVGDEIVNNEIFVNRDGSYEYSALLRKSEIAVTFRAVVLEGEAMKWLTPEPGPN
jgi:hypothetical protein